MLDLTSKKENSTVNIRLNTHAFMSALAAIAVFTTIGTAQAITFTVVNDCNQTIYPGINPASTYDNGGWTMTPNTQVTFTVPSNFSGRVWGNYLSSNPSSTLAEFTLSGASGGTDFWDVSAVDGFDLPMAITPANGAESVTATGSVLAACPAGLVQASNGKNFNYCWNPCSVTNNPTVCCTNLTPQQCRDSVNTWPAEAQQYVNDIHNLQGLTYSYPWDDWWGTHTNATNTSYTITFCPNNVQPGTPASMADGWPLAPTGAAASTANGQVVLTWNAVSGATAYKVYRSLNSGGSNGSPSDTSIIGTVSGTSYTDNNVTNGTTYYYIIVAVNSYGFSAASAQQTITASGTGTGTTGGGTTGGGTTGGGTSGPVSIDCGGPASGSFVADADFSGGTATSVTSTISTSKLTGSIPPQNVLQSNRYGAMTYTIGGLASGSTYAVTLYFAEEYWTAAGKREFDLSINGTSELTNFDIYATAGGENIAIEKTFNVAANGSGQLVLAFTNVVDNAQVNAITVAAAGGSISNGGHTLAPACATGSRLDDTNGSTTNGNHLQIWAAAGNANQDWSFANIGGNVYNLAVLGPYCLDSGGTSTNGGPATIWTCNGNSNQAWTATSVSGGYTFKDGNAGLCLDVSGAGSANGTAVDTWTCNGTNAQTWAVQ